MTQNGYFIFVDKKGEENSSGETVMYSETPIYLIFCIVVLNKISRHDLRCKRKLTVRLYKTWGPYEKIHLLYQDYILADLNPQ